MQTKIWIGAIALGLAAFIYSLTWAQQPAAASKPKNLQVLSKNLSKKEVKKIMKGISKSVDKGCDDCHDLEDFSKDTKLKKKARSMMRMVGMINGDLRKGGFKGQVSCITCHRGKEKPEK